MTSDQSLVRMYPNASWMIRSDLTALNANKQACHFDLQTPNLVLFSDAEGSSWTLAQLSGEEKRNRWRWPNFTQQRICAYKSTMIFTFLLVLCCIVFQTKNVKTWISKTFFLYYEILSGFYEILSVCYCSDVDHYTEPRKKLNVDQSFTRELDFDKN